MTFSLQLFPCDYNHSSFPPPFSLLLISFSINFTYSLLSLCTNLNTVCRPSTISYEWLYFLRQAYRSHFSNPRVLVKLSAASMLFGGCIFQTIYTFQLYLYYLPFTQYTRFLPFIPCPQLCPMLVATTKKTCLVLSFSSLSSGELES